MAWSSRWKKNGPTAHRFPMRAINGIKTGLMGPFAGIGDTLWQGNLDADPAFDRNLAGVLRQSGRTAGHAVLMMGIMLSIALCLDDRLQAGKEGLQQILESNLIKKGDHQGQRSGRNCHGCADGRVVSVSAPLMINIQGAGMSVQTDILTSCSAACFRWR